MPIASISSFLDSLQHVLGFILVLFALSLLWGLTALVGAYFKKTASIALSHAGSVDVPGSEFDPTEEEVAAIAACVTTLMGRRSRVVSIRSSAVDWSREGRREHFASHKIR